MMMYYVLFFVFLSVSTLVFGIYKYYAIDNRATKSVNARLKALENSEDSELALDILRERRGLKSLEKNDRFLIINKWLIQTGLTLDTAFIGKLIIVSLIAAILSFLGLGRQWYSFVPGLLITVFGLYLFLTRARSKRIAKFESQLPDALDIIVRSLRAGHPTQTAIALAARECPDPIGTEFGLASDEIRHGLNITLALKNMSDRVGMPDLIYVEAAVAVQAQSGGSLSDVVSRLSQIIRERFKLRQKIAALTSEGRISGLVLTGLPVGIGLAVSLTSPSYYGDTYSDPIFYQAMVLAGVLLVLGHLSIQKLLKFKY